MHDRRQKRKSPLSHTKPNPHKYIEIEKRDGTHRILGEGRHPRDVLLRDALPLERLRVWNVFCVCVCIVGFVCICVCVCMCARCIHRHKGEGGGSELDSPIVLPPQNSGNPTNTIQLLYLEAGLELVDVGHHLLGAVPLVVLVLLVCLIVFAHFSVSLVSGCVRAWNCGWWARSSNCACGTGRSDALCQHLQTTTI